MALATNSASQKGLLLSGGFLVLWPGDPGVVHNTLRLVVARVTAANRLLGNFVAVASASCCPTDVLFGSF